MENTINDGKTFRAGDAVSLGNIDQYELVRELGGGGFGTVYLARDTVSGVEVAVKGLPPFVKNNREEMENIRANFNLVHDIHHPHIAAALYLHPAKNVSYATEDVRQKLRVLSGDTLLVMAYAPGVTLSQWRKQFPESKVPLGQAFEITRQIASALDYAHERRVVHRDVKPANVMIETGLSGNVTARVLDFGLAAEIRSSMGRVSREIHDTSGTRPYMAPEQWRGGKQGPGTDQYALAVLFHELVTGEVPFASVFTTGDPVVMMNVVGREEPEMPSELPKPVRLALGKALAKKREERFSSCGEFVDALEGKIKVKPVGSANAGGGSGAAKSLVAAVAVIALLGGGVWYWNERRSAEAARVAAAAKAAEEARVAAEVKAKEEARLAAEAKARETERLAAEAKARAEARRIEKAKAEAAARIAAETKAREDARLKAEAEKMARPEPAPVMAKDSGREKAEREKAERERIAREKAQAEARKEAERKALALRKTEMAKKRLYETLASVETALGNFRKFRYYDDIQPLCDGLQAKYNAAKAAFDANDLELAVDMADELSGPKRQIETMQQSVTGYRRKKSSVDAVRSEALAAKAPLYAKEEYAAAERIYSSAEEAAARRDFALAMKELDGLEARYRGVVASAGENPEALYEKALAAKKSRDLGAMVSYFRRAGEKRHPAALANLGLCYLNGSGVLKNEKTAFGLFHESARLNSANAQYFLGGCYAKAIGVKYDKEKARVWMAIAKVNGSTAAADFLSKAGWGVSPDEERAIREVLRDGTTSVSVAGDMELALRSIAAESVRRRK